MAFNLNGIFGSQAPEDSAKLIEYVTAREGAVDAQAARRFLNNIHYSGGSLKDFPVELKLNLYEAIANDEPVRNDREGAARNAMYLDQLNQEMGLTDGFYQDQTAEAQQFFGPENQAWLEAEWQKAGNPGTFAAAMNKQINGFKSLNDPEAHRVSKFIMQSFSDFTGRPCPEFVLGNEAPNSCGAQGQKADGTEYIMLNANADKFKGNFAAVIDTLTHEMKHARQTDLANKYQAGEIKKGDPDYIAARVFAANLKTKSGYLSPSGAAGFDAYRDQPVEIDARTFGQTCAHLAVKNYGSAVPEARRTTRRRPEDSMFEQGLSVIFLNANRPNEMFVVWKPQFNIPVLVAA